MGDFLPRGVKMRSVSRCNRTLLHMLLIKVQDGRGTIKEGRKKEKDGNHGSDGVKMNQFPLTFSTVEYSRLLQGADAGVHQLQAGGQLVLDVLLSVRWGEKKRQNRFFKLSGLT